MGHIKGKIMSLNQKAIKIFEIMGFPGIVVLKSRSQKF